jgi:hypothetical protein
MATQISCIVRDGSDPDNRIDEVGGTGWQKSEDAVIAEIENGTGSYYVNVGGKEVDVVVREREGRKYLRTDPDETTENNLLSLPECS